MALSVSNLRILKESKSAKFDLATELFHRINRIIPTDQVVFTVPPNCRVREAVALMRRHGYSQVPVVENNEVLGVFYFRSFAQDAASATRSVLENAEHFLVAEDGFEPPTHGL
jgi:predicted transcriptional regulator